MKNILTIDVEDFYQGTEFDHRPQWASYAKQSTVEKNTRELLELLEEYGETATFFVLDDIAARFPEVAAAARTSIEHALFLDPSGWEIYGSFQIFNEALHKVLAGTDSAQEAMEWAQQASQYK